jgi:hypothetical protein
LNHSTHPRAAALRDDGSGGSGGIVTTTGGRGDVDLTAPDLGTHGGPGLGGPDGDDIDIIPGAPPTTSRGRMRAVVVGAIVVVLGAAAITVGVMNRNGTDSSQLSAISGRKQPAAAPPTHKRVVTKPTAKTPVKPRVSVPTKVVGTTPSNAETPTSNGVPAVTPTTLSTPPPTIASYPPQMLMWQTMPNALTVKAGGHATISVTVTNPTDGTVTLGHPLSCAPVVTPENGGSAIASGVCVEMAQIMAPHQVLTQQYTIYATTSGDASGSALATGHYAVRFENLHSIWMTVTAI